MSPSTTPASADHERQRKQTIAFLNWAHAIDHYVLLIYPTVVLGLEAVYRRPYADLIAISTASFVAFGVFSLPAGWLADRWSRRNMMAVFYFGCGGSLALTAVAPNLLVLGVALFLLGMFAAIHHPVGMPMLIAAAVTRGRTLAFNGVCGNLGAALASGITAALISAFGWRGAFLVPAAACVGTGIAFLWLVRDDREHAAARSATADVPLGLATAAVMFTLFIGVAAAAGLIFNVLSVALPKIMDERLGENVPLVLVGGLATAVFMCGALAQLTVGRLVERFAPHILFVFVAGLQLVSVWWAAYASGLTLLVPLALAMAAIYGQVTVNDMVIARYTADAWRGRVYAVRYFLTFVSSGIAVPAMALLYTRGGFALVLGATALVAVGYLVATTLIMILASSVERERARAVAAAE
jgi:MFS family permease